MGLAIEPRLPTDAGDGDDVSFLQGATILRVGSIEIDGRDMLAIEFQQIGQEPKLLRVAFSDTGLWLSPC
jgi:hypothetical protein